MEESYEMVLARAADTSEQFVWKPPRSDALSLAPQETIFKNSIFDGTGLSLKNGMLLLAHWAYNPREQDPEEIIGMYKFLK